MSSKDSGSLKSGPNGAQESPQSTNRTAGNGLSDFQQQTLIEIAQLQAGPDKCYGLAIKEALEAYYAEDVNHGRLYPNLDTLVEEGLVRKGQLDRRTNSYELTDAGLVALEAERDRIDDAVAAMEGDR